jgi:hypothetical protein
MKQKGSNEKYEPIDQVLMRVKKKKVVTTEEKL